MKAIPPPDLKTHLEMKTSGTGSPWNLWPDQLPVIKTTLVGDTWEDAYQFGQLMGRANVMRQVRKEQIPQMVAARLDEMYSINSVMFLWADSPGQVQSGIPNVLVLFDRHQSWRKNGMMVTYHGQIVEIGCQHAYDTTKIGNCWYRSTCTKCGFYYEVDSSG